MREVAFPTLFAWMGFALLALALQVLPFADLAINRGLGSGDIARIALDQTVPALAASLPFATLLGALIGLARLAADRELLALEVAGVSPFQVGAPLVSFAIAMAACAAALSLAAAPIAAGGLLETIGRILQEHPAAALRAGAVTAFGDFRLEAREVSSSGERLRGVLLFVPSFDETFFAHEASLAPLPNGDVRLVLDDGILLTNGGRAGYLHFASMAHELEPSGSKLRSTAFDLAALPGATLRRIAASDPSPDRRRDAGIAWQRRLALPVTTLWFGCLALPLALLRREASRASAVILGITATLGYYGLVQVGSALLRHPAVPGVVGVWLPELVGVAGTVWLGLLARQRVGRAGGERARPARRAHAAAFPGRIRGALLDRYVLTGFAELTLVCFLALLLLFLVGDLVDNLQWFVKYQSTPGEVLRFYGARIPVLASRVVPMALLLAASLCASLLLVRGELLGIWACGVSTVRAMRSILVTCVVLAIAYHGLQNELVPRASARASYLKQTEIKNRGDSAERSQVWFRRGNRLYVARSLDPLAGKAEDVTIFELDADWLPRSRTDAPVARHLGRGVWRLATPTRVEVEHQRPQLAEASTFAELGEDVPADVDTSHLTIGDLVRSIHELERSGYDATTYRVDLQQKLAAPLACLLLPLLGLALSTAGPPFWTPAQALTLCALEGVAYIALTGVAASLGYGRFLPPPLAGFGPIAVMTLAVLAVVARRGRRA